MKKCETLLLKELAEWQKEWQGMPEFVQESSKPFAMLTVRFANQQALDEFAALIGQKLTPKTKSIWHPQLQRGLHSAKRWGDANER